MHLPVTLHVALLLGHQEEAEMLYSILNSVKKSLLEHCSKRVQDEYHEKNSTSNQ